MQNNTIKNSNHCTQKKYITWKGLTLTDAAVCQILKLINKNPNMLGLQVTIKKSGCAGFRYFIDKAISFNEDNLVYERKGAKLFIPLKMMPFIDGTELDYVKDGLNYMFKFKNPQVHHSCGCGESFNV